MDKHKAWATTIVAPKSVGSSTTKGQMKPTFRVSLTASQAGENSQINAPELTNVSSILSYLTSRRNQGRRTAPSGPTIESAKQQTSSNEFQNSNSTQYHHKLLKQNFNRRFLGLKTKQLSQSKKSIDQKFHVEKLTNQTALNSNVESTLSRTKPLTNWKNNEPNNIIPLRDLYENQIMRESRISVARAETFFWTFWFKLNII